MKEETIKQDDLLYLQVSGGIEKMIADEVLAIGDKLPSVRILSEEHGISMSTAFRAYYHLESKGLIESRPKSGYYVKFNHRRYLDMPEQPVQDTVVHEVSVSEMIDDIYKEIGSDSAMNFALAVPDASLLPAAKLTKSVVHALRNDKYHCITYEDTQGNPELRKEIARLSFNREGKIKPDEIVITSGCLEAVLMCLKAVTNYGDTVAIESPAYFGLYQAIESLGLNVAEIPTDPVTGIIPERLQKAIKKFSVKACVIMSNFSNPLGSTMPDEHKKMVVEMLAAQNIPLIEDDIYGDLYFGKSRPRPCKYYDKKGLVMYCSSLSKSLAPGYRIGWTIPGKFTERVNQMKRIHNISCPALTQAALAHYLRYGRFEYHLKNLRRELHTQSLRYVQAITNYFPADTKVSRPMGGFVLWLELNKKINAFKLRAEARKHDIYIVPGKIFSSGTAYSNCIRISFGKPWNEDVDYGLMMLGKIVKKMINN